MKQIPHPKLNPYELNRKTTRLTDFNYACSHSYYVTLCTYQRFCLFGEVQDAKMHNSPQGYIADVLLTEIPHHFPMVHILNYTIMPDHIHLLFYIDNETADKAEIQRFQNLNRPTMKELRKKSIGKNSLSSIIKSYKSAVTFHCHRLNLEMKWQASFYDRVIRNTEEHEAFSLYITRNPQNWDEEREKTDGKWPI